MIDITSFIHCFLVIRRSELVLIWCSCSLEWLISIAECFRLWGGQRVRRFMVLWVVLNSTGSRVLCFRTISSSICTWGVLWMDLMGRCLVCSSRVADGDHEPMEQYTSTSICSILVHIYVLLIMIMFNLGLFILNGALYWSSIYFFVWVWFFFLLFVSCPYSSYKIYGKWLQDGGVSSLSRLMLSW